MFKATKKSATFILFIYQTKYLKWLCTYSTYTHYMQVKISFKNFNYIEIYSITIYMHTYIVYDGMNLYVTMEYHIQIYLITGTHRMSSTQLRYFTQYMTVHL